MKRAFSFFLAVILLICACILPGSAAFNASLDTMGISADIVLLLNLDSNTVIFDKNADKVTAPASLTKITTAILTIENCQDLDAVVTVKQSSIDAIAGTNSSTAGLLAGEELTASFYTVFWCAAPTRRRSFWRITSAAALCPPLCR